jgi:hypothetical protein
MKFMGLRKSTGANLLGERELRLLSIRIYFWRKTEGMSMNNIYLITIKEFNTENWTPAKTSMLASTQFNMEYIS